MHEWYEMDCTSKYCEKKCTAVEIVNQNFQLPGTGTHVRSSFSGFYDKVGVTKSEIPGSRNHTQKPTKHTCRNQKPITDDRCRAISHTFQFYKR